MESAEVLIAGAGIVGLSLALELACRGMKVVVLDRGPAMAESSWAAAGMLAAGDPENPPQLTQLARFSLSLYPEYLKQIERLSGKKVPLRSSKTIQAISAQHNCKDKLSPAQLHALEPDLQIEGREFLLLDEPSLDPRDLCAALPIAAAAAGVKLLLNTPVISIDAAGLNAAGKDAAGNSSVTIQTPMTSIAAAHFINCAGAWAESPSLGRLPSGHPKIAPRKGQMTTVRLNPRETPGRAALSHVLRTPDLYLVPRGDGRITIGATVEHCGFDKTVQPQAIASLLKAAAQLWPPIARAEVVESWAGLRPGSADSLPLIGRTSGGATSDGATSDEAASHEAASHEAASGRTANPGCWIASGHFRNGILLAPGTARALAQAICGEIREVDLAPFDPARRSESRPLDRHVPLASDNRATATL